MSELLSFLYLPEYHVESENLLFVSTHVHSSYFMDSYNAVALMILTGYSGK